MFEYAYWCAKSVLKGHGVFREVWYDAVCCSRYMVGSLLNLRIRSRSRLSISSRILSRAVTALCLLKRLSIGISVQEEKKESGVTGERREIGREQG